MSTFLQLASLIAVILLASKLAGYLSIRIGQPAVLGELLVGILLGPSVINLLDLPFLTHEFGSSIAEFGEFGVLMLMFIAGLELHFGEMRQNLRVSILAGLMGVLWPVLAGWGTGLLFGMEPSMALFLGLTIGATSVSISAQTLIELKALRSRVGLGLLGAAVFDDVLIILFLSIFLAVQQEGGISHGIWVIILQMVLFLAFSVLIGMWFLPRLLRTVSRLPVSQSLLATSLIIMLFYSIASEYFGGMAAITGAFLAGLMLGHCPEKERIETGMHALAYGLFVPIFFVNIGLSIDLHGYQLNILLLTLAIIAVAVAGKWLGAGWGARLGGLSRQEASQLGAGMISRGEVGLIVADVGIAEGLIGDNEFSAIVVMVLVTTLITPPILRAVFAQKKSREEKTSEVDATAAGQPEAEISEEAD